LIQASYVALPSEINVKKSKSFFFFKGDLVKEYPEGLANVIYTKNKNAISYKST